MDTQIYPFKKNREEIPSENSGYPTTGSHIFVNYIKKINSKGVETTERNQIEIFLSKIQEKYPDFSKEKLQYIVENIVQIESYEM